MSSLERKSGAEEPSRKEGRVGRLDPGVSVVSRARACGGEQQGSVSALRGRWALGPDRSLTV